MQKLLLATLTRSFLGTAILCCSNLGATEPPLKKAPELAFRLPDGKEQLLSSYRGKVISLEFIHTTCSHCQQASRVQKRLQQTYGDQGFQAIDVAINPNAESLIGNFASQFQLNFPIGWTTTDQALSFLGFSIMRLYVVPQIVVIDRAGNVRAQTSPNGDDAAMDNIRSENSLTALVSQLVMSKTVTQKPHHPISSKP